MQGLKKYDRYFYIRNCIPTTTNNHNYVIKTLGSHVPDKLQIPNFDIVGNATQQCEKLHVKKIDFRSN